MSAPAKQYFDFGSFRLDPRGRILLKDGEPVPLTPKLFETLCILVENAGEVITKDELLDKIWPDTSVEERSLSQNIFLLRKALGDDSTKYIETVPKIGYRFILPVARSAEIIDRREHLRIVPRVESQPKVDLTPGSATASFAKSWKGVTVLIVIGIATIVTAYLIYRARQSGARPLGIQSMAVLPFKPVGLSENDEYLGFAMADSLITRLSGISQIIVRPTSSIRKYVGSEPDVMDAGREQKVDAVLEGSIQRSGDRIRLTVQLVRARDGVPLWSYKCDELSRDLFLVQDSISEQVAEALTLKLSGEEQKRITKHHTENTDAYQAYIKGRFFWNKRTAEGFKKALEHFDAAVASDPEYALAHVGIADSYTMLADYDWLPASEASSRARAAITRALEIDDSLPEAHASLGDIKRFYDWDWAGAEREYQRAIQLNPNYVTAHQWYAEFLSAVGRHEEAIKSIRRAEELDPASVVVKSAAGWVYFFAREYDQSIAACQRVIEMDPSYGEVHSQLRRAYEQKSLFKEALLSDRKLRSFRQGSAQTDDAEKQEVDVTGRETYWRRMLALTQKDLLNESTRESAEFRMAEIYAQLGNDNLAVEWLNRAYNDHSFWMPFIGVHAHLDPLRSDSRFKELIARVGLPVGQ